jgi:tRNA-splicing ligase RtcB
MLSAVTRALRQGLPHLVLGAVVVNCHHNYVEREHHFGREVWLTRKGAVRARTGDMGIIPGSMGTRSYIVRGKGEAHSFHSCSHGAGRAISRRRRASNAGRTQASSTRRRQPTRTSTP